MKASLVVLVSVFYCTVARSRFAFILTHSIKTHLNTRLNVASQAVTVNKALEEGMAHFRVGQVTESIKDFDSILEINPALSPYLWQRGLSLYYADRFEDGAQQFRKDVAVNPNDTEESIWAFLCEARFLGFAEARKRMLKVERDSRPYMRVAYSLFRGDASQADLARLSKVDERNYFYSNLYLGLYNEAQGEESLARTYIQSAAKSQWGRSGDYMHALAVVHMKERGWQ